MKFIATFLIALLASQSAFVYADNLYRLPKGKSLTTSEGEFKGYTLEEFKVLLGMDADLKVLETNVPIIADSLMQYVKVTANLRKQLVVKDNIIGLQDKEIDRVTDKWVDDNRLRHVAENEVDWWTITAWGSAGAFAILSAVLAGVLIVNAND